MEGNTALGASSPAKPAFTRPEPLSHTRAVVSSSSHMVASVKTVGQEVEFSSPAATYSVCDRRSFLAKCLAHLFDF